MKSLAGNRNGKLNKSRMVSLCAALACVVTVCILSVVLRHMLHGLAEQDMAGRWSRDGGFAQVSCFFSANQNPDPDRLEEFEHMLDAYLTENSIELQSGNPGARLWVDAYSADGKITLNNGKTSVEADATGIGGDFFLFHPQELLYGNYFSGNDLNSDYCVIDEDTAWQLFGSGNVAGMQVTIGGIPHIVQGVVRRPKGRLEKAAGLDGTRVFVSYHTLEQYGVSSGINHYEVVMPNPVRQFAYKYVADQMGKDERETEVVENSARFGLLNCLKRLRNFDTRSMNGRAIIYPYWENIARGYEDLEALFLAVILLISVYPVGYALRSGISLWRHKGWTFRDLWFKIIDRVERYQEKKYYQKNQTKS